MSAAASPSVAVVTSVYNAAAYLEDTVQTVLDQSYGDFVLILVNDGSTDGSGALCDRLAERDERIAVIHQPNGGIAVAANAGVAEAWRRGATYVARLDSDDRMMPERLGRQVAFFEAHPGVVCVGSDVRLIDELGRFLTVEPRPADNAEITDHLLRGHCPIANPSCMIRAEALRAVDAARPGPYDESYAPAEDFEMFLRLGEVGALANLSEPLTEYRLHGKSASAQRGWVQRDNCERAVREACERRGIADPPAFEAGDLWRPTDERASRLKFALMYGWWAWQNHEFATASSYGRKALRLCPWDRQAWALMLKSMLRKGPASDNLSGGQVA